MEIYQLRTFVTVAQQGHLTQAAELLHLSQPAVTAQIKALEEEVGMPLFERTAGGVTMTRAGQELLPQAQSILASAREIINHAKGLKGQTGGKALIGLTLTPATLKAGEWVAALVEKYPLLDLRLQHGVTGEVLNLVRKKELDAGFYLGKNPYVNVNTVLLTNLPFRIVLPNGWKNRIDLNNTKELGRLPWVGLSQFSSLSKITAELWRELNISPKKVTESDNLAAVLELVACGVGVALAREEEALEWEAAGRLTVVPAVRKLAELQFVYPSDRVGDPILEALLQELIRVWALSPDVAH
ncbi:LysR family transcriptional regulator [Aquitalea sp. FJL05]|jgi:DNA-binding transcriptional LysR family regulator|uniref:LysR family transcriptional regulator n=1 Tax=Aquitalea palustris TaxID=2480983 RepID=A0A454JP14_9NEIS|nr:MULTISPECIES: LysR family transcriptional regulator [Aquitalea]RMD01975.1 LysR family transcriptional regulator [Aquitalea palustris]RQO73591.1 LysR family transcriptional regulator [Aquitalea sp. FJL05]